MFEFAQGLLEVSGSSIERVGVVWLATNVHGAMAGERSKARMTSCVVGRGLPGFTGRAYQHGYVVRCIVEHLAES